MTDHHDNDELLKRLSGEDPAAGADPEARGEREAVRSRAAAMLASGSPRTSRWVTRPRLVTAALILVLGVAAVLALTLGGSSSGPGPTPALAIEKTPKWVTLRLKNPNASEEQMNQELEDAGIDRVRVKSVPGPPKKPPHRFWGAASAGTWAGYVELGPRCQGGVTRFGYDVDIPISTPYDRANRHGAEDLFDLTVPRHSGALAAEEVGTPFSRSTVRLPTDSIDDPRNAAKVLVAVRPRSAGDTPESNDIGADQLIALGGVPGEYGQAVKDGQTSCSDFGLKPFPKPTFPPSEGRWVVLHVGDSEAARRRMDRDLRTGGINGTVRLLPTTSQSVGQYLGLERRPPLPKHHHGAGNRIDIVFNDLPHVHGPPANDVALRRYAFRAFPNARWIFYVGRAPHAGESPKVLSLDGPVDADAALKRGCPGLGMTITTKGEKYCGGSVSAQLPVPRRDSK
jgi:hypothetical protein